MSATAAAARRTSARRRPSRAWYWLVVALVLLGVTAGVTWGAVATLRTHERAQALPRTGTPGRLEVTADRGTDVLVYFEGPGRPACDALGLTVTGPGGAPTTVRPYDLRMYYEIAGWSGTPIASFSAPRSGSYIVTAKNGHGAGAISAGDDFVRAHAVSLAGAFVLVATSVVIGVMILVVLVVLRSVTRDLPAGAPADCPAS